MRFGVGVGMRRYRPSVSTSREEPAAKPVWERGARVKFHYTQPDFAELILLEQVYRVSAHPGRAGHGLYVTTVHPGLMPDEELLKLLFARPRPESFIDGVVVLRDDAFPWERYEPRKYVHRTELSAVLDLSLVLVGIGTRRRGVWLWSEGVYV
jgi:hypothetical protein